MNTKQIELTFSSQQPIETVPAWADKVPRWTQLDPASAAIADAWHEWQAKGLLNASRPPVAFVLASAQGSNRSDFGFARGGAFSPSRFVSTLPSVNLSALFQTTGWVGPMYCVQDGARSFETARAEAALLCETTEGPVCLLGYEIHGDLGSSDCRVDVRCVIMGKEKP